VVIVGGGFGGGFLAVQLDKLKDFQVTLIDNKVRSLLSEILVLVELHLTFLDH